MSSIHKKNNNKLELQIIDLEEHRLALGIKIILHSPVQKVKRSQFSKASTYLIGAFLLLREKKYKLKVFGG